MEIRHEPTDDRAARICIEGLERDLRILHLTDSHMAEGDERDLEAAEHVATCQERFAERTPGGVSARQVFDETLEGARVAGVDAAVLTGDIIHFPSRAAIEIVGAGLVGLGVPSLYTLGNHDWHFPHLEWSESTRQQHYPRFESVVGTHPACQSMCLGGVRLIALDNSTYQVDAGQVEFLRQELATGDPCILFVHIPVWVESLMPAVLDTWQAPIVMGAPVGWTEETRQRWKVGEATPSTRACTELLASNASRNLAAIFCGHVHFSHVDAFRDGRFQYVTQPGYAGGARVIELVRL
jgi:3',5'-cyclic AMP phosphodiesterase CpdA